MRQLLSKSLLGVVGVLVLSAQPSMALVLNNEAIIVNSGSTNTIGYRIYVMPSGEVSYVDGKGQGHGRLPANLTRKFFRDLKAAMPLSNLPVQKSCIRSVSFGTSTTVKLGAQQSPDINCFGNNPAQTLKDDVRTITSFLRVTNIPKSQGHPLPPQNF